MIHEPLLDLTLPSHTSPAIKSGGFLPLRINNLEVRLATNTDDVERAQRLRYDVFYGELHAIPSPAVASSKLDFDAFDTLCDHLLVIDTANQNKVVGTYRLMRRNVATAYGRFYSASEYNISLLESSPLEILEVGRSCVSKPYRTLPTMQILWRGLSEYMNSYNIDILFGCASFHGTDTTGIQHALSYLYHNHLAPADIRPFAHKEHYVSMDILDIKDVDPRKAIVELPPLIKGYIRMGGFVGDGAFIDTQFNTTDVCILVQRDMMTARYRKHYKLSDVPQT